MRGRLAALVVLASVIAFDFPRFVSTGSGGSDGGGPGSVQWTFHSPSWSTSRLLLAAVLLLGAGVALWLAHGRLAVSLASVVATAGVALAAWAIATPEKHMQLSQASFQGVRIGVSQAQLLARFGSPVSTNASAVPARGGPPLGCFLYQGVASSPGTIYLFCFDHGRLTFKGSY